MKLKASLCAAAACATLLFAHASAAADDSTDTSTESPQPDRAELLRRFDANGDGRLSFKERRAARKFAREHGIDRGTARRMRDRVAEFDTDGDGRLNETERAALETAMRAEISANPQAMARIDTDGDGTISDAEWTAG